MRAAVHGQVITADDAGYDEARAVWSGADRKPLVVVRPANAGDVIQAVGFARENALDLSVRGGGHSAPSYGTNDGGVVIDLSLMRGVRVEPFGQTARAEGGALIVDVLAATDAFGLTAAFGIIGSTGIGGLTLGGGSGHLSRGFGLTIDNIISMDVVTAASLRARCFISPRMRSEMGSAAQRNRIARTQGSFIAGRSRASMAPASALEAFWRPRCRSDRRAILSATILRSYPEARHRHGNPVAR